MSTITSIVTRIRLTNVSAYLIRGSKGYVLVDTGHAKTVDVFFKELQRLKIDPSKIILIILTHTHFDHAGGAKAIKEQIGAPIVVHQSETKFLLKGYTPIPRGTRWKGKTLSFIGRIFAPFIGKYPKAEADVEIDEMLDLYEYGVPGKLIHTPGHTEGSMTVILDNGEAIAGDNVLGVGTKECYPPFANMKTEVINSWQRIIDEGARIIYPAHGRAVMVEELEEQLPEAKVRYG